MTRWQPGDVIAGQYAVLALQGEGGMGVVYRVRHLEWDVELAVKRPLPEYCRNARDREVFAAEAETWVSLGFHPNVCTAHYVRVIDDVPCVFAEYVPGGSLAAWIEDGRLHEGDPVPRILDLAIQIASGLDHSHGRDIVHQDVKPANILIGSDDSAKVTDFGLARAVGSMQGSVTGTSAHTTRLAPHGGFTTAYASPEQLNDQQLSRRTDVFSFAVSILECFTGAATWRRGEDASAVLADLRHDQPPGHGLPAMPAGLDELLARCLAEEPGCRPTMAEIVETLTAIYQTAARREWPRLLPSAAELLADEHNNRGLSLLDLDQPAEAAASFTAALAVDPRHPLATYNDGLWRWRSGKLSDEAVISRLQALDASDRVLGPLLAEVHRERGDVAASHECDPHGRDSAPYDTTVTWPVPWHTPGKRDMVSFDGFISRDLGDGKELRLAADGALALTAGTSVRLWDVRAGQDIMTLPDMAHAIDLSADGRYAVAAGRAEVVYLWDLSTAERIRVLAPDYLKASATVVSVRLNVTAGIAVGAITDGQVLVWDLATGKVSHRLDGHGFQSLQSSCIAVSADGRTALTSCRDDKSVKAWDLATGRERGSLPGIGRGPATLAISPDGRVAAVAGYEARVVLWDLDNGDRSDFVRLDDRVTELAISDDARLVLSGAGSTLRLWERDGRCLRTFRGHGESVVNGVFAADGQHVITGSADNTVRRWPLPGRYHAGPRLSRPRGTVELNSLDDQVASLVSAAEEALSEHRHADAVGSLRRARAIPGYERAPSVMAAWRAAGEALPRVGLNAGWPVRTVLSAQDSVTALAISPDGQRVAVRPRDRTALVLDVATGEHIQAITDLPMSRGWVGFSADGKRLLTADPDGSIAAWSVASGEQLTRCRLPMGARSVRFTADGRRALVRSGIWAVQLWDLASSTPVATLPGTDRSFFRLWVAPEGDLALTGGESYSIRLWDVRSGQYLRELRGHTHEPGTACISRDRRFVLSCGAYSDPSIRWWDAETGELIHKFTPLPDNIADVAVTGDSRYAVTGGTDGVIRVWDTFTGRCLTGLTGHRGSVDKMALATDGNFIVSGGDDGTVRVWALDWNLSAESQEEALLSMSLTSALQRVVELTGNPGIDTTKVRLQLKAVGGDPADMVRLGAAAADDGDLDEAERWFQRAAAAGNRVAAYNLGALCRTAGDPDEAERWFRRAAEAGYGPAMAQLGLELNQAGRRREAGEWLRRGAEGGDELSMLLLGLYQLERGAVGEAQDWLQRAADKGSIDAMYNLACTKQAEFPEEATQWHRRAAERGHTDSMYNLAVTLQDANRPDEAQEWYTKAAEGGQAQAANNLGNMLWHQGRADEAMRWYQRSAEGGEPNGMFHLAGQYKAGGNRERAEHWYRRAAENGHATALKELVILLTPGGRGDVNQIYEFARHLAELGQQRQAAQCRRYAQVIVEAMDGK